MKVLVKENMAIIRKTCYNTTSAVSLMNLVSIMPLRAASKILKNSSLAAATLWFLVSD